ncbi:hypothetical protein HJC23_007889 [Cyclotella cryptica]|uniref:Uncharacterized protein n=1 Tax=Cyclotella cryptica TaxID=29204 RepID=A0ABD3R0P7_9STRA
MEVTLVLWMTSYDKIRPSISTLIDEVISHLDSNSYDKTTTSPSFDQVVIAGEGEPTLRMDALLAVSRQIQLHRTENGPFPLHRHMVLRVMMEACISHISVALNTANRHEYDVLMEPCCYSSGRTMPGTAHDMVCEFMLEAAKVKMEVEITGID